MDPQAVWLIPCLAEKVPHHVQVQLLRQASEYLAGFFGQIRHVGKLYFNLKKRSSCTTKTSLTNSLKNRSSKHLGTLF
jgi:hypothetical protein